MTFETPVPPEVRAEAEKSQAKAEIKNSLGQLINRRLEGGGEKLDTKTVMKSAEEMADAREEIKRIQSAQEAWNKLDRGENLTSEDKESIREAVEAWQEGIASELQEAFSERAELDTDKLRELEAEHEEKYARLENMNAEEIYRGFRVDKTTMKLLRETAGLKNQINQIRKKADEYENKIQELRKIMEGSQKILDFLEAA